MLQVDILLRYYVVNEPYDVLAGGTANFIIYFNNYVNIIKNKIFDNITTCCLEKHFLHTW